MRRVLGAAIAVGLGAAFLLATLPFAARAAHAAHAARDARDAGDFDARACRLPAPPLGSPLDTAAWCAREFLVRNGYTELPPSRETDDIALEPSMDFGRTLSEILSFRRNTVALEPAMACITRTGFLVSFLMPNQVDQPFGRGIAMTHDYLALTLLRAWVSRADERAPNCLRPQLPPAEP